MLIFLLSSVIFPSQFNNDLCYVNVTKIWLIASGVSEGD